MPEVIIRRNPNYLKDEDLKGFFKDLQVILAEELSVSGTDQELTTNDIVIRDFQHSEHDVGTMDLEITIITMESKERKKKLSEYPQVIIERLKSMTSLDMLDGFMQKDFKEGKNNVWVILLPSAFSIF